MHLSKDILAQLFGNHFNYETSVQLSRRILPLFPATTQESELLRGIVTKRLLNSSYSIPKRGFRPSALAFDTTSRTIALWAVAEKKVS